MGCVKTFTVWSALCLLVLTASGCHKAGQRKDLRYRYEQVISFGAGGDSGRFLRHGWANPENDSTWTVGTSAQLKFQLPRTRYPVGLRMRMAALFKEPELPIQPVLVFANGTLVAEWHVALAEHFTAVVPRHLLKESGLLEIRLSMPRAATPRSLGLGDDNRVLAVGCLELEITRTLDLATLSPTATEVVRPVLQRTGQPLTFRP